MGLLGDFAKGFVIMMGVYCVIIIVEFALKGHIEIALLFLLVFTIPFVMIAYEYLKNRKKHRTEPTGGLVDQQDAS